MAFSDLHRPKRRASAFPLRRFGAFAVRFVVRLHEIDMADTKRASEMEQGHHGGVTPSPLEAADILLRET
jgi:hypothetical protein